MSANLVAKTSINNVFYVEILTFCYVLELTSDASACQVTEVHHASSSTLTLVPQSPVSMVTVTTQAEAHSVSATTIGPVTTATQTSAHPDRK